MEPVLRRAGLSISTPGISYASIDHSMWWYQDIDINEWHLYVQDTPIAAHNGRGLGITKVYAQNGDLVAPSLQEVMVRAVNSRPYRFVGLGCMSLRRLAS